MCGDVWREGEGLRGLSYSSVPCVVSNPRYPCIVCSPLCPCGSESANALDLARKRWMFQGQEQSLDERPQGACEGHGTSTTTLNGTLYQVLGVGIKVSVGALCSCRASDRRRANPLVSLTPGVPRGDSAGVQEACKGAWVC